MIFFFSSYGNWVNVRKGESGYYILLFCPQILLATNLVNVWDWKLKQKYLLIREMIMLLRHLQIRNSDLMLAKLKDYFINQFCFSSRLTGLECHFQKHSGPLYQHLFHLQILVSKLICFQKHMRWNNNFGRACRFYFDYFHISVHSFIRDRKQLRVGEGGGGEGGGGVSMLPSLPKSTLLTFMVI